MEQNIIEGNKLIAEFDRWDYYCHSEERGNHPVYWSEKRKCFLSVNLMEYRSSWDWLMPVVEKIEGIRNSDEYEVDIFGKCCDIGGKIETVGITKIQAVWLAVIEFIKWHNANK